MKLARMINEEDVSAEVFHDSHSVTPVLSSAAGAAYLYMFSSSLLLRIPG